MIKREPCIYKITNLISNKVYIGQTRISANKRKSAHFSALRKNKHVNNYLQKSWNKYGESNFEFSVICYCEEKYLDKMEIKYIKELKSLAHENGYNLQSGGNNYKFIHESTRKKISDRMKKWSIESGHIEKLADLNRGDGARNARQITLINTGEVFGSIVSAVKKYPHVNANCIQLCCSGKTKQAGKMEDGTWMVWEYKENAKPKDEYRLSKKKTKTHSREVICINTQEVFDSLETACVKYKISKPSLIKSCKGILKTCGKLENGERLQWSYYESGIIYDLKDLNYIDQLLLSKKVILVNTGEIFNTIGEASRKYNLSVSQISNCCKGKNKSAGKGINKEKLIWEYHK